MGYPRGGSTEVTWLAGNDWSNGKVINLTPYVTDIHWEGDNLVAEAQIDDGNIIGDIEGMSMSFSVESIDWSLFKLLFGYMPTDLHKMHTDYRRKTRRRNRRR